MPSGEGTVDSAPTGKEVEARPSLDEVRTDQVGSNMEASSADSAEQETSIAAPAEDGNMTALDRKERFKALQARAVGLPSRLLAQARQ